MSKSSNSPKPFELLLTLGDPKGIGWEVTAKAVQKFQQPDCHFKIIGHPAHFELFTQGTKVFDAPNVKFIDISSHIAKNSPHLGGEIALKSLETAVTLLKNYDQQALVTAPLSKTNIKKAGSAFPGHTEWLCDHYQVQTSAMMLFHERLRVVLVTIHKPLQKIFSDITVTNITSKLQLLAESLQIRFGISQPKIAVCGLNPHASENGLFGDEEQNIITPAINEFLKTTGLNVEVTGPLPADTVFFQALQGEFDAVLCHYHDQGLIPIKTTGFHSGVNTTLGLPIIRTSPDHGTAFDIAGREMASESSMLAAIEAAHTFLQNQKKFTDKNL